ncbi:MAG: sigma-70 family RNA polymerase sigma factor [Treponema sp.]|jgi:RNA polymerase sigma-70 factor (ECF subfamily)|nr:sigma-70 family RNA polymerase sigma factor [Treponema sp.]
MMTEGETDDQRIVAGIVSGQKELFRILVHRHEQAVYGMGLSFFRNTEDAADFTQEVFLKAYHSLSNFEGRSRFSTWLYKIAYNTALNGISRRKEYRSLAEGELIPDRYTPEHAMLQAATKEAVIDAVKELPDKYRICVDLFFFYDRSYQEIEVITGYPINTIKSHVFRAKKLLRQKLAAYSEGG